MKKNNFLGNKVCVWTGGLVWLFWGIGCVDQINFDQSVENPQLVVDGLISLGSGPHEVSLSQLGDFGAEPIQPTSHAEVTIIENGADSYQLSEISRGVYQLAAGILETEVGVGYKVMIQLEDGRRYQSEEEIMPVPTILDSVYYELVFKDQFTSAGQTVSDYFLDVFIDGIVSDGEEGPFIRWTVEESYNFTELPGLTPLDPRFTCYLSRATDPQNILLFDASSSFSPVIRRKQVAETFIDWTFQERHYFRVFQQSLTASAFEYWERIDQVSNQVGSVFDPPPAGLIGNISNVDDPNELVLGYVQAVAQDTATAFTVPTLLSEVFIQTYCARNFQFGRGFPQECYDCLLFDNSTYERPDYWD